MAKIRLLLIAFLIIPLLAIPLFTACEAEEEPTTPTTPTTPTEPTTPTTPTGEGEIVVMNPDCANHKVERVPLTARLDTLEGKSIYLIDVNWGSGDKGGAYIFLNLVADWLEDEYNCTTTVVKKAGAYFFGDPDLFAEAAENADAVVFGVSG